MTVSSGFSEMLVDTLGPLGRISVRRMFGGGGVYCDGVMLGLIADDVLFLKGDDTTKAAFEAEGCGPFVYEGKGKPIAMSYWRIPERLLDEPEEMVAWARTALGVARRGAAAKAGSKAATGGKRSAPSRKRSG